MISSSTYGTFKVFIMHRLKRTHQPPFEFRGWLFYDSTNKYSSSQSRKKLEAYVRLYITDLSWVVLECVRFDQINNQTGIAKDGSIHDSSLHVVRVLETIEDALDELATLPLHVVSPELYSEVMRDMTSLAKV